MMKDIKFKGKQNMVLTTVAPTGMNKLQRKPRNIWITLLFRKVI